MKSKLILTSFIFIFGISIQVIAQIQIPTPQLPSISSQQFNILDYGAVSDATTDNTQAIQHAIDAAAKVGGGQVIIPAGTFLSGPLKFVSNLDFHLNTGAILQLLPIDRYPGGTIIGADFISGVKLHDIAITGNGTIEGQGSPWWPFAKVKEAKRPRMIKFTDVDKILIEGVTLQNAPMFHIAISGKSSNVTVSKVVVRAPASTDPVNPSHNTDACDVSGNIILIKDCDISTGDDNFTCGGGTSNVHIMNCTYGYGHGLSIGSYTKGGVANFLIEHCKFNNTECGIRIKSDRDRGGVVENLVYRDIQMTQVGIPILVYATYMAKDKDFRNLQKITPAIAATYPSAQVESLTPIYKNILFQNITATTQKGKRAGLIWGLPEAPTDGIIFKNVQIEADGPLGIFNSKHVELNHCSIRTKEGVNMPSIYNATVLVDGK